MINKNEVKDGEITVFAGSSFISKEAVLNCIYWFGDKFHTSVSDAGQNTYRIQLKPLESSSVKEEEMELYRQKLERDLVDFQLRQIVAERTQNVRDLLVAKAFSNGEFDEDPPGDVSDPLGFHPNNIFQ